MPLMRHLLFAGGWSGNRAGSVIRMIKCPILIEGNDKVPESLVK